MFNESILQRQVQAEDLMGGTCCCRERLHHCLEDNLLAFLLGLNIHHIVLEEEDHHTVLEVGLQGNLG